MRRKIVAGNWKMNKTLPESLALAEDLKKDGLSVNVQKADNGEIRYKKLCNIKKGGEVTNG